MESQDLKEYKEKLGQLTEEEQKQRDLYLKGLADGTIQGPEVGYPSVDKPWLQYFETQDMNYDIPKMKAYDYLFLNNQNNLKKNAINYYGIKVTFEEMFKKIESAAKSLKSLGVKEGDIVTLAMANTPEMVYLFYALNRIGAVCNVIDPRYSAEEIKRELNAVESKLLISLDLCEPNISKIIEETSVQKTVYLSAMESMPFAIKAISNLKNKSKLKINNSTIDWKTFKKLGEEYNGDIDFTYISNTPIALVHTGGTTGLPKGVLLTNENFVSMAHMHKVGGLDYDKDDRFLNILPPFIAYCLCNGINMPLTLGLELTLIPKFEPQDFPILLDKHKPNHVLAGPILWEFVMKSNIKDLSYLKTPVSGGDSLNSETEIKINEYLKSKGCKHKVAQGYGMTEVSSAASFSFERANQIGSVGIPFIKNSISVFDPETHDEKTYGEEGEIWISTPTAMKGYYNNPEATDALKITTSDGKIWIRTGDLGIIEKTGNVRIIGRMKRCIVRSGNKIYPSNIESIVLKNKNIDSCSIVGVFDEQERSVPVAHIILSEDCNQTKEEVVEYIEEVIRDNLPEFNVPKKFVFRNEMPLTSINKVDYKELELEELTDEKIIDFTIEKNKRM